MNSGTNKHPFAPGPAITRDRLIAYLEDRANTREQFDVEFAMEHDPLLADAVEGLNLSGAIAGLHELEKHRPGPSFNIWNWIFPIVLMVSIFSIPIAMEQKVMTTDPQGSISEQQIGMIREEVPFQIASEVTIGTLPEIHIGAGIQRIAPTISMIDRNGTIERLRPIAIDPGTITSREERSPRLERKERSGLQLHYLHDLKIIHPKELYPYDPVVQLAGGNVTADRSDRTPLDLKILQPVEQAYLEYMDRALLHYHSDPHACIEELEYLLDQYPDDPNALFYAGMSHLNIGRSRSASYYFSRVLSHRHAVFNEEADFHNALAIERNGDRRTSQEAFARIAKAGGFYSERALERMLE